MAVNMKEMIAEAARKLLVEKKVKKLTVKDIVEECQITRQAFYYHFADIPELLQWVLERGTERFIEEYRYQTDAEEGLKNFFLLAIHASPYVKRSMESNYGAEIERLLTRSFYQIFEKVAETSGLYPECRTYEMQLILRYHSQAIMGLLRFWTEEDSKNLDQVVHTVYLLITGEISVFSKKVKESIRNLK